MDSAAHVLQIIEASSAMHSLIGLRGASLVAPLMSDLSGDLLQDALAVVLFPEENQISPEIVDRHLQTWENRAFALPDQATSDRLITLWLHIILLAEDYLGKATHSYPPRAYHDLPFTSLYQRPDRPTFDICNLSLSERRRTIWAFLRYELLARLERSKCSGSCKARPSSNMECELVTCVEEYLRCLYGGIFARLADAWLPCRPTAITPTARGSGLVYPDNLFFDPSAYAQDLGLTPAACSGTSSYLASHGTYLAVHLVRAALSGSLTSWMLRRFSKVLRDNGKGIPRADPWEMSGYAWPVSIWIDSSWAGVKGMAGLLYPRFQELNKKRFQDEMPREWASRAWQIQIRMYRQRAWVFFDDWRFYPLSWTKHFPDWQTVRTLEILSLGTYQSINQARILRRSGAWNLDGASDREVLWAHTPGEDDNGESLDELEGLEPVDVVRSWLERSGCCLARLRRPGGPPNPIPW